MNAGGVMNAAGKPGIIYLKSVIDGSPKSNGPGKMWERVGMEDPEGKTDIKII
jgi:hypothetical protein